MEPSHGEPLDPVDMSPDVGAGDNMAKLDAEKVKEKLRRIVDDYIECSYDGDIVVVDTPFLLQDGHFLRVYVDESGTDVAVTDGGFLQAQIEMFARSSSGIRERSADVKDIANELSLNWDGELGFTETTLERAVQRIAVLARGVDRAIGTLSGRPPRRAVDVRRRLRQSLQEAGLLVTLRSRPILPNGMKPVIVDQLVKRDGKQAAIEVLTSKTESGASISVDRAIANFHVLDHYKFEGKLIAVYDRASPAASAQHLDRFRAAKPRSAFVVSDEDAVKEIEASLAS